MRFPANVEYANVFALAYCAKMRPKFVLLCFFILAQDCGKPASDNMSLINEDILKVDFPDGKIVTFQCAMGYRRNGGSGETTCKAGTWTPWTLTCESEYF